MASCQRLFASFCALGRFVTRTVMPPSFAINSSFAESTVRIGLTLHSVLRSGPSPFGERPLPLVRS